MLEGVLRSSPSALVVAEPLVFNLGERRPSVSLKGVVDLTLKILASDALRAQIVHIGEQEARFAH